MGLNTQITYNDWGQVLTQSDPHGNSIKNTYDGWGKLLSTDSNLLGTTTYVHERDSQYNTIVTSNAPDGNVSKVITDKLGQESKTSTKSFGQGQFVSKSTWYDVLGRKTKDSEPYLDGQNPDQFNLISYDDSVFPTKITTTAYTGKKTETITSGLTITIKETNSLDYGRTTSNTTDALSNVISSTDKGGTIQFSYDAAGRQIKAHYEGNVITTKYDLWGRKVEVNDPSTGLYKYQYSGLGQVKKIISPKGTKDYNYNSVGQLISQKELSTLDSGQSTDKTISFAYSTEGLITRKSGIVKGQDFSTDLVYDQQGRLVSSSENSNGITYSQKDISYDNKGRITSYEKELLSNGVTTKVTIENLYSPWNGELYQIKDKNSGKVLWELKETNARGQVVKTKLGASDINNTYDVNGFLTDVKHSSSMKSAILQVSYSFDAIKNELKSRTTSGDLNIVESFDYDDNNRLINWTNPATGIKPLNGRNIYDIKGRITQNDQR